MVASKTKDLVMSLVGRSAGSDWFFIGGAAIQSILTRLTCQSAGPHPSGYRPQDITAIIVDDRWDHGWSTEHGSALQMPRAYSMIVRSLENLPECATLTIARRAQASGCW